MNWDNGSSQLFIGGKVLSQMFAGVFKLVDWEGSFVRLHADQFYVLLPRDWSWKVQIQLVSVFFLMSRFRFCLLRFNFDKGGVLIKVESKSESKFKISTLSKIFWKHTIKREVEGEFICQSYQCENCPQTRYGSTEDFLIILLRKSEKWYTWKSLLDCVEYNYRKQQQQKIWPGANIRHLGN